MLYDDGGIYIESSIYILYYPGNLGGNNVVVSYGTSKKRSEEEENYDFMHYCSTKSGSSGSPILNILNNKVIGINKQRSVIG
jgi:V8-like Glu-specific endopeptidase